MAPEAWRVTAREQLREAVKGADRIIVEDPELAGNLSRQAENLGGREGNVSGVATDLRAVEVTQNPDLVADAGPKTIEKLRESALRHREHAVNA